MSILVKARQFFAPFCPFLNKIMPLLKRDSISQEEIVKSNK